MDRINVKKFGFACGFTGTLFYTGCTFLMVTTGYEGTVRFINSLLHGIDVSAIIRMDISLWEAGIGLIETFVLGWLAGACIAIFYNISVKKSISRNS
ncbi:DUF5676 family membrane protein [Sinomicrobium kalidii]|uniref:DUF5676 family membrane protein n=1 Tax=Sinomicrobium kalidii TaxID=2900738 RepID=UPI001E4DD65A|nr:DUF5676 family membrane protein [Sinomicrobium kalidii]UGU14684.1 DUF5676 family membrane protein [Sinomicrobium kalidii]